MDWKERKIGELVEINKRSIDRHFKFTEIEYIDTASVNVGKIEQIQNLKLSDAPSRARRIVNDNDILYSTVRPNLKHFAFVEKSKPNLIASTGFAVVSCKEEIEPRFLYSFLATDGIVDYLMSIAEGQASTYPAFNPEAIEQIKIKLPPLPVQRRIAQVLGRYDALIENYAAQIRTLEAVANNLYREWFVRHRINGCELPIDENTKLSVGWEQVKLKDFVEMNFGQSPSSEFYNETGDGLPFHQGVGTYGSRFPKHEVYCSVTGKIAEKGDVLFSVRAPVGRLNIADRKLIIGRGLAALKHKKGSNSFLFYLLQEVFSKEDMIGNGAIFAAVSKSEFEEVKVFYPNEILVENFEKIVKPVDEKISNLQTQITNLREMRDKLLPRLLSGKLEIQSA